VDRPDVALGWAFAVGGGLGLVWVVVWAFVYRLPRAHPRLGAEELALIESDRSPDEATSALVPLRTLLARRDVWGCILARVFTDPISFFSFFGSQNFFSKSAVLAWLR